MSSGSTPTFFEQGVLDGQPLTSASLRGRDVLLFFGEGASSPACLEQVRVLEQQAGEIRRRSLMLLNIATDPPKLLRRAVEEYDVSTPTISDQSGAMSRAYGALGQGMHPNTDGHTFVLIDGAGRIRWRHDYTTMYVPPERLLAEIPSIR